MPTTAETALPYLLFVKFFGTFICPVLYIVSFANMSWITSGSRNYGLWNWCDDNVTAVNDSRGCFKNSNSTRCESIEAGDSPAYFEAVRVCACFALIAFLPFFLTLKDTEGLGKGYIPAKIAFIAGTMGLISLAPLIAYPDDDSRWKEVDHQLGWCVWTALGSCGASYIMCIVNFAVFRIKHKPTANARRPRERTVPLGQRVQPFLCVARFVGTILCPVLYIAGFASQGWVTSDTKEFGLWGWCYNNFTDEDELKNCVSDSSRCHGISPGDSPAYFEGVRTCVCFTLIVFLVFFLTLNEKEGLGMDYKPVKIACTAGTLGIITLITFIACYGEDSRWKDSDYKPGWCFYMATSACVLSFILVAIQVSLAKLRKRFPIVPKPNSNATNTTNNNRNNNSNSSSNNTNSSRSTTSTTTTTTVSTTATSGATDPPRRAVTTSTSSTQTQGMQTPRWGGLGTELSVVGLPPYEVPAYDPSAPYVYHPPPSYEDVIGTGARSPPPAYEASADEENQKEHN